MSQGKSTQLQKPIQIYESSIQKVGNLYVARVFGDGATHKQAMDFARTRGEEPTGAHIRALSDEQSRILSNILYGDGECGWAWLRDESSSPYLITENPLFYRIISYGGRGISIGYGNGDSDDTAGWVIWKGSNSKADDKPIEKFLRKVSSLITS